MNPNFPAGIQTERHYGWRKFQHLWKNGNRPLHLVECDFSWTSDKLNKLLIKKKSWCVKDINVSQTDGQINGWKFQLDFNLNRRKMLRSCSRGIKTNNSLLRTPCRTVKTSEETKTAYFDHLEKSSNQSFLRTLAGGMSNAEKLVTVMMITIAGLGIYQYSGTTESSSPKEKEAGPRRERVGAVKEILEKKDGKKSWEFPSNDNILLPSIETHPILTSSTKYSFDDEMVVQVEFKLIQMSKKDPFHLEVVAPLEK